jgi:hypothetical protein
MSAEFLKDEGQIQIGRFFPPRALPTIPAAMTGRRGIADPVAACVFQCNLKSLLSVVV